MIKLSDKMEAALYEFGEADGTLTSIGVDGIHARTLGGLIERDLVKFIPAQDEKEDPRYTLTPEGWNEYFDRRPAEKETIAALKLGVAVTLDLVDKETRKKERLTLPVGTQLAVVWVEEISLGKNKGTAKVYQCFADKNLPIVNVMANKKHEHFEFFRRRQSQPA